jgi:vacuolar-type H+-ATPase subunit E/Vma4
MPLDSILQALEAEAERQVAEIEQAAQAECEHICAKAQAEAVNIRQKHVAAIQAPLQSERARILNQAKLEALRVVMGTRETLMASALDAAAGCLAELPASDAYAGWLKKLTQEAVDSLGIDSQLSLCVRSRDLELMSSIVEEMQLSATVGVGLEGETSPRGCLGGLVATTCDGRVSLVNTLEARLDRVASLCRSQIAEMVLGAGGED